MNCLSDHDQEVLAALEQHAGAALRQWGCTAVEYVMQQAEISRQLERYVSGEAVSLEFGKLLSNFGERK